jgi:hypothetical protein
MSDPLQKPCSVFERSKRVASGPLVEVAAAYKAAVERGSGQAFLFDDRTGKAFDIDVRGTMEHMLQVLRHNHPSPDDPRGPGRPKLGVAAREVTLLPSQWDWLAAQPGGASVTLRKLVDQARRSPAAQARAARDAAYAFMSAMAGDLENFEEASRALFAGDRPKFEGLTAKWPKDIRAHIQKLENP